jgi:hypothetical protein
VVKGRLPEQARLTRDNDRSKTEETRSPWGIKVGMEF